MNTTHADASAPTPSAEAGRPSRRGFFFGAASAGVAVAAVTALPRTELAEAQVASPLPPPERGGGYTASEHVQRYYKTARV